MALYQNYKNRGLEIAAINVDEHPEAVIPRMIRQFAIDFPVYTDPGGKAADIFDVHAIPLTVVLDKHRHVLMLESGEKD